MKRDRMSFIFFGLVWKKVLQFYLNCFFWQIKMTFLYKAQIANCRKTGKLENCCRWHIFYLKDISEKCSIGKINKDFREGKRQQGIKLQLVKEKKKMSKFFSRTVTSVNKHHKNKLINIAHLFTSEFFFGWGARK